MPRKQANAVSITATFWVARVDLTLAYARMSGRDS